MRYWIKKLQTQLGIGVTGTFDIETLEAVVHTTLTPPLIKLLQEFFNRLDNMQIEVNGVWDRDTKEMLTYFQKEYGHKYNMQISEYSKLNESTWKLIAQHANTD